MKPKTMILMVVAIGCGLVASYMTSKLLAERKAPPPEERVTILVARTKIPKNTQLKEPEKFFDQKSFLKSDAPKSFYSEYAEIKDKRVNKDFKPDVHISPEDVQDRQNTVLPIPDGYGAIGVRVTAEKGVSFFITPGDKVDVMLTQRGENASSGTILRDMLVVSVADKITRDPTAEGGTIQAQTVNLAVKPYEAALIRLAETEGELSLLLRKDGDPTTWDANRQVTKQELLLAMRAPNTRRDPEKTTSPDRPATVPDKPGTDPGKPATDPTKLPVVGWSLEELKKPDRKVVKADEEEKTLDPIRPAWTTKVYAGTGVPTLIHFFAQPDGSMTQEQPAPKEPEKNDPKSKKP
jgi:Flp pilus assembly protein CpaB